MLSSSRHALHGSVFETATDEDPVPLRSLIDYDPTVVMATGQYGGTLLAKAAAAGRCGIPLGPRRC